MGARKGMSLADKRMNILSIFHESKGIFVLKVRSSAYTQRYVYKPTEYVRRDANTS